VAVLAAAPRLKANRLECRACPSAEACQSGESPADAGGMDDPMLPDLAVDRCTAIG
jgi:hypothetical protein